MKTVRANDNSKYPKSDFKEDIGYLMKDIADKSLSALRTDNVFIYPLDFNDSEDLENDKFIVRIDGSDYRFQNVIGFLGRGDQQLIISSRFYNDDNDFFFQYLIEKVFKIPNIVSLSAEADFDEQILNLLMMMFPGILKNALRKGLIKDYVRLDYNNSNPRGTVNVNAHIKKNIPFLGKIAYSRHEYSYDNPLTELIRHTVEFIKSRQCGNPLLCQVKDEVNEIVQATPAYSAFDRQKVIRQNQKKTVKHAYYQEYGILQKICLSILRHRKMRFTESDKTIYGILFDCSWLWEEYLASVLADNFHHPKNRAAAGIQHLFSDEQDYRIGRIYPDFIGRNNQNRLIADAKYKPNENIGGKDYLQVLAYMFRFDAKTGFYLYPWSPAEEQEPSASDAETKTEQHDDSATNREFEKLSLNQGTTYDKEEARTDISVIKLGFEIPNEAKTYTQFSENMETKANEFMKKFAAYCEPESGKSA